MNDMKTPPRPTSRLVRAKEICRDPKTGTPGILPINRGTWYAWLQQGIVPPGQRLGPKTVAWPIEVVLAVGAPK
jgi:predicted DNA-binding transcriptional regulator AlpA